MTVYQMLGIGIVLVIFSVFYTYQVDRKVNRGKGTRAQSNDQVETTPTGPAANFSQVLKTTQVKDSLTNIEQDLDELIELLKEKEISIRDMANRIKNMPEEPVEYTLKQVLQKSAGSESPKPEEVHAEEPEEGKPLEGETMAKYDKIFNLLEAGFTIEDIARTLNMGYREVELAAKLRQKGAKVGA